MPSSFNGSPEQLLGDIANSAIKRINLGIVQAKNSSEPIYNLPPLQTLPTHNYEAKLEKIPLKFQPTDMKRPRFSFHPLIELATHLNCLPSFTDLDLIGSIPSSPRCKWITSSAIRLLPAIQQVWFAHQSEGNYKLICGYETYGTLLRQNVPEFLATVWIPQAKPGQRRHKGNSSDWHTFLEFTTLPALIDIFFIHLYPHFFSEAARAKLIFWLDTLGLLSLLFEHVGKCSSKRAALVAADLPESTYNYLTRALRQRQCPLPCPSTPQDDQQHEDGASKDEAPRAIGTGPDGQAVTSNDGEVTTEPLGEGKENTSIPSNQSWTIPPI